jgi:hypothetical protein
LGNIIGYNLYGPDNDSYMSASCDNILEELDNVPTCNGCGYRTDYTYANNNFKIKKRNYDISYTYDGVCIVSLTFKEFCKKNKYSNIIFKELPREEKFYQFIVENELEFDYTRRETKLINYCESCGFYENVIGSIPTFLKDIINPLDDGFYRSDLLFGSRNEKSPLIIISPFTKELLDNEKLKGVEYKEIMN